MILYRPTTVRKNSENKIISYILESRFIKTVFLLEQFNNMKLKININTIMQV